MVLSHEEIAALAALANAIIPADERDEGAASVHAAPRIAEKIAAGVNTDLYIHGLLTAQTVAWNSYGRTVADLAPGELYELLAQVKEKCFAFFKQFRMDVYALYLSDPTVWQRIGFPGTTTAAGGYPDFDQPQ